MSVRLSGVLLLIASCTATESGVTESDVTDGASEVLDTPDGHGEVDAASPPGPSLVADPSSLRFGVVPWGASATRTVALRNAGAAPVVVGALTIGQARTEFSVGSVTGPDAAGACVSAPATRSVALPQAVAPGGTLCVNVTFEPTTQDRMVVGLLQALPPPGGPSTEPVVTVTLEAWQVMPVMEVTPAELNFDAVSVGESRELSFTIRNAGQGDLVLTAVTKSVSALPLWQDVTVLTHVVANTVLAPETGDSGPGLVVTVRLAPTQNYAAATAPLGTILLASNDPEQPSVALPVRGQTRAPRLQVTPTEALDFGPVHLGKSAKRSVVFTNTGTSDLKVSALATSGGTGDAFVLLDSVEAPVVVAPGDFRVFDLRFTNTSGPEHEVVIGELVFASNDPDGPTSLALRAERVGETYCALELDVAAVDFGVVPFGTAASATLVLTNVGSSPCTPFMIAVWDGEVGPDGALTCAASPALSGASKHFAVLKELPSIKDSFPPGQSTTIEVSFSPAYDLGPPPLWFGDLDAFGGLVQVVMFDNADLDAEGTPAEVRVPDVAPGTAAACNLVGASGLAQLAAVPDEVVFAPTPVGCASSATTVSIVNGGATSTHLCGVIALGGGCADFEVHAPVIPPCAPSSGGGSYGQELLPGATFELDVVHRPSKAAAANCTLHVLSELDDLAIALTGSVTPETHQTDVFEADANRAVDVLFVVDNAASMGAAQSHLASAIGAFVAEAAPGTDYHLGVIASGVDGAAPRGELRGGGGGQPRFFTAETGLAGFAAAVTSVGGSATRQGLEAARLGLTPPLTLAPGPAPPPCAGDSDCAKPLRCVPSMLNAGNSYCMGWNAELLREGAALEVVFVSDEADQSPATLPYYEKILASRAGLGAGRFRAHAIVGDSPAGCTWDDGEAAAGGRYLDLALATGGQVASICSDDWSAILKALGAACLGPERRFQLTRPAVAETIAVTVAGTPCAAGWSYSATRNAVIFDAAGPCAPASDEAVVIDYEAACGD